jgi:adenylyltransferase/sulfurtransferase
MPDYSRQMALKEVGAAGQAKLRATRVLVVGCGGLGVPVISYLAGAGVGRIGLVDSDRLEPSNLHRQTLYSLADVGERKAELAAVRVRALNPEVDIRIHAVRLDSSNASQIIEQYDLVVDCTDNFSTKFLLNDVCVLLGKPVIFSSVYQYEGQLQVVRPDRGGACLRCVWPEATRDGIVGNCAEAGVLGPVPGTFGSLQAFEALKLILGLPGQLSEELLVLDLLTMSISRVRTRRSVNCPEHARSRVMASGERPEQLAEMAAEAIEVEFDSLQDALQAGFELIDIRESREVAESPTPAARARHVPMAELLHGQAALLSHRPGQESDSQRDPPNRLGGDADESRGDKFLLICASGRRSLAAAQELRSRGLRGIYSLRGGLTALRSPAKLTSA